MNTEIFIVVALGAMTAMIAAKKGYNPALWFIAPRFIGLLILIVLPFTNRADQQPEEQAALRQRGNTIGAILSILGIALIVYIAVSLKH